MTGPEAGPGHGKNSAPAMTGEEGSRRPLVLHLLVGFTVGGTEKQLLGLMPRLREMGYDQAVCCLKGWGPMGDEYRALGIPALALGGRGRADVTVLWRLRRLLRRMRPAILHTYTSRANWAGALAGRLAGVPRILLSDREVRVWMRPWHLALDRGAFGLARGMVVPSQAIKGFDETRAGLRGERIWVVPNGVDAEALAVEEGKVAIRAGLGMDPGAPVAGYVGRLEVPVKGLAHLLEAVAALRQEGSPCTLGVFGEGPWEEEMRRRARALGIQGLVRLYGVRRDIPRVLKALDLLVLPSLMEGCPNVILEAMAARVPVLATRVGGVPEMVEHGLTGWLVPPGDPQALARGIREMLQDRAAAMEMADRAHAWVRANRGMDVTARALARVYEGLLGSPSHDGPGSGRIGCRRDPSGG